ERIHERAVARDTVIEVRSGGEAGGADVADHLALAHASAGGQTRSQPRKVVVHGLVARAVAEAYRDAVATRPTGRDHSPVGHGTNGGADGRRIVDGEVGTHAAQDRMWPRVGESGRDPCELERGLEEALFQRAALGIVVAVLSVGPRVADAGQALTVAHVL